MTDFRDEYLTEGDLLDKRNGGCAAVVNNKLYVWGGHEEYDRVHDVFDDEEPDEEPERIRRDLPKEFDDKHPFDVFNFDTRTWSRQATEGSYPVNGIGSILEYDKEREQLCLFGGWKQGMFDSDLYVVSLNSFRWEILQPSTDCKPSPRYNAASVLHKNKLCVFGGVGSNTRWNKRKEDPWADEWVPDTRAPNNFYGWNNEYFNFDLVKKCWTAPLKQSDIRPSPRGGHRMARIDDERAAMFGGKGEHDRNNELWVLNLDQNSWTGPIKPQSPEQPWPIPCRFFSFTSLQPSCCIAGHWKQQILLLWGKAKYEKETDEEICHRSIWILEFDKVTPKWTEFSVSEKPRAWHVAGIHPTQCEVVVTGGNKHLRGDTGPRQPVSDTCTLVFGETHDDKKLPFIDVPRFMPEPKH